MASIALSWCAKGDPNWLEHRASAPERPSKRLGLGAINPVCALAALNKYWHDGAHPAFQQ